ncbi:MAG TPA: hypothetical protein VK698_15210 [Kofleriaceae bacterium]|nr:hypothetical protein [Kofleriaceae bacterium]
MGLLRARMVLAALLVASLPGCLLGGGDECTGDGDCGSGDECTRTGECVPAGSALRVVVRWTVNGAAPTPSTPEPCAPLDELEVVFHAGRDEPQSYRPVPCALGQAVYDKMPPRFDAVEVVAYDRAGSAIDSAEQPLAASGETAVLVDLELPSARAAAL